MKKQKYMCADGVEVEEGMPVWYFMKPKGEIDKIRSDIGNLDERQLYSMSYSTVESCVIARDAYLNPTKPVEPPTLDALADLVLIWANVKGLINPDFAPKQLCKITEELGEVAGAYLKGNKDNLREELGDVLVTVIIFAAQNGLDVRHCLGAAYNKISTREGKLVNGTFVKDEDLK